MTPSLRRATLAALAACAAGSAGAHARLLASSPAQGQVLSAPPIEIRLTFNEAVAARHSAIKLVGADGKNYDADRPHADKNDPNSFSASVPVLRSGVYRARWTTAGGDGQKAHGDFSFVVK